ncbi:dihydroorotate dehydrogenase electron transfer subunit [Streptococcus peroris]|uniref:Dihydroorotate dehydrogenase B (NAD(+)), electron transfer subunit n=1 Tax=Streptococcus peroris ATCC 700780 TaxID=888746 RepID=E8KAZ1_9STRE|nr:dihydroorotate dehydrogenase electron transfer subunit [Streptococcus peroris]EFX40744.1 dihydroorotate dehydrogenase, electron transfer subunit [Streptococcus peroris ATCC 700780]
MNPNCKKRMGSIRLETMKVVAQEEIAPAIYKLVLEGEMVEAMRAGQFLHLRVPDDAHLLRRPISISSIDKSKKQCHLIYRIEGSGTAIFSTLKAGDSLDVMGPQGNGFDLSDLDQCSRVLLVGGGIGVPPLLEVAKQLNERSVEVTTVLGFATKDAVILEAELSKYSQVFVTTDDGSYGIRGNVSVVINELDSEFDAIYSCGAPGMMKYINQTFYEHPRAYLSLESRMACGMGACYACVLKVPDSETVSQRVCEDGPVFKTGTVVL